MDIANCIPRDKHDLATVARAETVGFPALDPALASLLSWVQDMNWPVAEPMVRLLRKAGPAIVPHLQAVLRTEDDMWKHWVMAELVAALPSASFEVLRPEIARIATDPSRGEMAAGTPDLARTLLDRRGITPAR